MTITKMVEGEIEFAKGIPEFAKICDEAFRYLTQHPSGARMTELKQELGMGRIQTARVLKNLIEENKVKKLDIFYTAI